MRLHAAFYSNSIGAVGLIACLLPALACTGDSVTTAPPTAQARSAVTGASAVDVQTNPALPESAIVKLILPNYPAPGSPLTLTYTRCSATFVLSNVILTASHCFCNYGLAGGATSTMIESTINTDLATYKGSLSVFSTQIKPINLTLADGKTPGLAPGAFEYFTYSPSICDGSPPDYGAGSDLAVLRFKGPSIGAIADALPRGPLNKVWTGPNPVRPPTFSPPILIQGWATTERRPISERRSNRPS